MAVAEELAGTAPSEEAFLLPRSKESERLVGIVDLGANTARLVVFAFRPDHSFRLVDSIREPIRLAAGMGSGGTLQPAAVSRALEALRMFVDYATASEVGELQVIATSALRDAANRDAVLAHISAPGLRLSVLSGEEEARLGVSAVANGLGVDDAWVVDLGGGSVQLSRMEGRGFVSGTAFPLGAVRLTEACIHQDPPAKREVAALEETVASHLGAATEALGGAPGPLVAMGGTVRNLARMVIRRTGYPLDLLHGFVLKRQDLEAVTAALLGQSRGRRARTPGLNPDRADVIVAGALVFRWLLRHSGRDELIVSGHGVREGAFYRHFLPPPHLVPDLRRFSVANLFEHFAQPRGHTSRVRFLAARLFAGLAPLHELGAADAELLDAAAVLHDIGSTIGYYRHHRHGAVLVNAAALAGFSHREQALISLLVRYHRRATPKLGSLRRLTVKGDDLRLRQLAICLRLAEDLERSRSGRVVDVSARIRRRVVRLSVVAGERPQVEISQTLKHAALFERVFGRKLELDFVAAAGPGAEVGFVD